MGDPTEPVKGGSEDQDVQSDIEMQSEDSDIDNEAEQIQPATNTNMQLPTNVTTNRPQRSVSQTNAHSDTVQSILSSIANPHAAVIMPFGDDLPISQDDDEIDADRMERFYSGALSAITKMRRQTMKAEVKTEKLRDEVGHANMQAWTDEHFDSLPKMAQKK